MKTERTKPYAWTTWLTKLLAGEAQCRFALWFRAHYKYDKIEDPSFDLAKWSANHNALVDRRQQLLEAEGWECQREDENAFKLEGRSVIFAGKPDLYATHLDIYDPLVSDGKTGKQRNSDWWQVLVYMYALPRTWVNAAMRLTGEIVYTDARIVPVPAADLTRDRATEIQNWLRLAGWHEPPKASPSAGECARCDIPKTCCPDRIEQDKTAAFHTNDF